MKFQNKKLIFQTHILSLSPIIFSFKKKNKALQIDKNILINNIKKISKISIRIKYNCLKIISITKEMNKLNNQ